MIMKLKTFTLLATLLVAACVTGAFAILTWNRTINLSGVDISFTVYEDAGLTQVWASDTVEDVVTDGAYSETYYIANNDGNVPIVVTGVAVTSGVTATWPTGNTATIAVGGNAALTVELSGAGSCTITFTSAAA